MALALPEKRSSVAWAFWVIHLGSSHTAAAFGYTADLADKGMGVTWGDSFPRADEKKLLSEYVYV